MKQHIGVRQSWPHVLLKKSAVPHSSARNIGREETPDVQLEKSAEPIGKVDCAWRSWGAWYAWP